VEELELYHDWLNRLQDSGYRLTTPRRKIVEVMATSRKALSPLEVFDLGRVGYPGLGLVTVYRTLEKLDELGMVQRVHGPDGCHMFLRSANGHEHVLLCTSCGQAEFFSGDDLDELISSIESRSGYKIREHWLQLYGLCFSCRRNASS
jgi:Fur family ferric uptake transcriptional regulator